VADWRVEVTGADEPMTYACQFAETDHNYLHRRWAARGWHYWWEHREDGHTLVLSDDSLQAQPIDGASPEVRWQSEAGSMEDDGIAKWKPVRRIMSTRVAVSSFDFKAPRPRLKDTPTLNQQGDVLPQEVYDYVGAYGFKDSAEGSALSRRRMQEIESRGKYFEAESNQRFLMPRRWFRLTEHFEDNPLEGGDASNNEFLVSAVLHSATNNHIAGVAAGYSNIATCFRRKIPWRPGAGYSGKTPVMPGPQTAIVVGPKGSEIHTDAYGRVRVQFHWDRIGSYDEKSSAWIRVASSWTGKGYGFVSIPRVGQEVVVQFLDGNPDRPLITGCVYNQDNMPPFGLPGGAHKTGFQTRSTPGGGGLCEMVIHDDAGKELINILSQKDMVTTVLNDKSTTVHGNHSTTVNGAKRRVRWHHRHGAARWGVE
jgi:type VI secretion system secreted protein VgrG